MQTIKIAIIACVLVSLLLVPAVLSQQTYQEKTTGANVTVNKYVAIGLSTNLTAGILFGTLDPGTNDNNATGNSYWNESISNASDYSIKISDDSNTDCDICTKDNAPLTITGTAYTIGNGNFTWNATDNTTADEINPWIPGTAFTTSYVYIPAANDSSPGDAISLRFWLDIVTGQRAGTYNNTVYFKGTENTTAC